ncbi:hypothetical protein [Actinoplanes flavus]|uniref:Uncharacterized protein n=1 Tax=Actinoplanes flavus TaxID=2820290 RepID=A0ABS3UCM0_9ACTN|nr:hypothetical protein [Actinoplanes flavus]MBO3736522.1 hypothetical protein [Actinoplanes flavus]
MSAANTPGAPRQERCISCGAGIVVEPAVDASDLIFSCSECAGSARSVVAERVATATAPIDALHRSVERVLGGRTGIDIRVLEPESAVVVAVPSGYRWYVYPPFAGVIKVVAPHAVLHGPDLAPVPGLPLIMLTAVEDLRDLMDSTQTGPVAQLIEADLTARMEIDLFDPDALLDGGI